MKAIFSFVVWFVLTLAALAYILLLCLGVIAFHLVVLALPVIILSVVSNTLLTPSAIYRQNKAKKIARKNRLRLDQQKPTKAEILSFDSDLVSALRGSSVDIKKKYESSRSAPTDYIPNHRKATANMATLKREQPHLARISSYSPLNQMGMLVDDNGKSWQFTRAMFAEQYDPEPNTRVAIALVEGTEPQLIEKVVAVHKKHQLSQFAAEVEVLRKTARELHDPTTCHKCGSKFGPALSSNDGTTGAPVCVACGTRWRIK